MMPAVAFNELSLQPLAPDQAEARQRVARFIDVLRALKKTKSGKSLLLRLPEPIDQIPLADGYWFAQWRNDPEVDRDLRREWLALQTNSPVLSNLEESHAVQPRIAATYYYREKATAGLGAAHLLDGIAVGFCAEDCWDLANIELIERSLHDDGSETDKQVTVKHASKVIHVSAHEAWLKEFFPSVRDGRTLWEKRKELFPILQFCLRTEKQICDLDAGHPLLGQIIQKLRGLQRYAATWKIGHFDTESIGFKVTPESMQTLQMYPDEHTFLCPDEQKRLFSWHARLTPDAWRLFLYPEKPGTIYIGHIGPKLPNASYST